MWTTIYTDASYHTQKGAAGAYYIRSNHVRITHQLKLQDVHDANIAEIATIAEAITEAVKWHQELGITLIGVHIVTDSGAAISALKFGARQSKNKIIRKWQEKVVKCLNTNKLKIKIVHIKGHQRVVDVRTWLNNELDKRAYEANQ